LLNAGGPNPPLDPRADALRIEGRAAPDCGAPFAKLRQLLLLSYNCHML